MRCDILAANETNGIMNNSSDPTQSQPQGTPRPEAPANPQPSQRGRGMLEPLRSALNDGAHRANAAAEKAVPKVSAAVSATTYWLGYGVSFATVFSYTIVKELAPQVLKAGCRDGASNGRRFAEDLALILRAQPHDRPVNPSRGADASTPAPQPGAA